MMASHGIRLITYRNLSLALKAVFTTSQNRAWEQMLGRNKANICPVRNLNPPCPPPATLPLGNHPPHVPQHAGAHREQPDPHATAAGPGLDFG